MHSNLNTKYYFISKFDTNNIDKQDKQTAIIYRNYSSKTQNEKLILKINSKKYNQFNICGAFNLKHGTRTLNFFAVLKLIIIKVPDIIAMGDVSKLPDWYL